MSYPLTGKGMLKGRKILLGVTASIAAYKSALLIRLLVKSGAEVKVVMTPSARDFISPLTLGTLSRNEVLCDMFNDSRWADHVRLGRWADCMVIAPLSCNSLAKMATGLCDNLVMAVYLSATCPVMVAPAMDEDMWKHPTTVANLERLESYGNRVIPSEVGELASGLYGQGRMAEPETILEVLTVFLNRSEELKGKRALVTAGPTYESIDPVRFIGNHSSGKMGVALARALRQRGADVSLVLGPVGGLPVPDGIEVVRVQTANEMYQASVERFPGMDIAVMAAAVADYTPKKVAEEKIKKNADEWTIELVKTPDILKTLGGMKREGQFIVGFALETNREEENAKKKLHSKNADLIVMNSLRDSGAGFGHDTNRVTVFGRDGSETRFELAAKERLAIDIVDIIIRSTHG
jgi:phosphopantothenoylcysteine decarboxylase/phosphopantothenate--cysteine ligase